MAIPDLLPGPAYHPFAPARRTTIPTSYYSYATNKMRVAALPQRKAPSGLPFPPLMESTRALRADLFDPASLAALGRIEIVARWIVDGFMSGLHRSPRKGFSVEFAEYRPYQPGDDLRYIDWKIAARSDRWVVRQYEEETNLRASDRARRQPIDGLDAAQPATRARRSSHTPSD